MKQTMACCVVASLLCGCASSVSEVHYFKSDAPAGRIPNYYRLDVSGGTFLADARYLSGYFDETAVDAYFSETRQPQNARFGTKSGESSDDAETANAGSGGTKSLDPDLEGKSLVLLLSSNSDEIANQIGAVAESQQFTGALANLFGRERFTAAAESESDLAAERAKAKEVAALGTTLVTGLAAEVTAPAARTNLLEFANRVARDLGAAKPFATLDELKAWLDVHRNRLGRD